MVWSSAMPDNVNGMVRKIFTREAIEQLVAVWGRNTLHLNSEQYRNKVQVYKQLQWIWDDKNIQARQHLLTGNSVQHTATTTKSSSLNDTSRPWNQSNTLLIDDSFPKAAAQPHNLVEIDEFTNQPSQRQDDILAQVVAYIEKARWASDVSAFARSTPFQVHDPQWQWEWPAINWSTNTQAPKTKQDKKAKRDKHDSQANTRAKPNAVAEVDADTDVSDPWFYLRAFFN
jgi:hypothetical protein